MRTRTDPAKVLALRRGDDRDGIARTWQQVGNELGLSPDYVRELAQASQREPLPLVVIDPREYYPGLVGLLSDADVARWQADPTCLCGCGGATRQVGGRTLAKTPVGSMQPFKDKHEKRMPWFSDHADRARTARMVAAALADERGADCTFVREVVMEFCELRQIGLEQFAVLADMSYAYVCDIVAGRHPRVSLSTIGRLQAAMGEEMRPEVATAYKAWRMRKNMNLK
jgi:hypothetical protein